MWLHCIQKGNSSNIQCQKIFDYQAIWCQYSYTSVRTLCFVLKNIQNFLDLDACKQLFVLNLSAIKKNGSQKKKNYKSMIFLE